MVIPITGIRLSGLDMWSRIGLKLIRINGPTVNDAQKNNKRNVVKC